MNHVKRLFIGKSAGDNTGTTLPTIGQGDLLFINGENQAVLTPATIAAIGDRTAVYIAMGLGSGQVRLSSPIRRTEISRATHQPFRPKAEQIDDVTLGLTAGKTYRLVVVLKDELRVLSERQTKCEIPEFVATGVDATDGARLAALVTKFRATKGILAGSFVGGKLRITGLPVAAESVLDQYQFVAFSTAFHQLLDTDHSVSSGIASVVTTVQKADGGSGLPIQVIQFELEASGNLGNTDLRNFDRSPAASRVDQAATYDITHVLHFDKHQGDHEFTMTSPVQTTIATNTGSALSVFVETMLEAFITKTAIPDINASPDLDDPAGL